MQRRRKRPGRDAKLSARAVRRATPSPVASYAGAGAESSSYSG
jgi:hypothetical protein